MPCRNMNNYIIWKKKSSRIFLFLAAFLAGGILAQIRERFCACGRDGELGTELSAGGGKAPVANVTIEEQPMTPGMHRIRRIRIYLTFDCGYENGNTEKILEALYITLRQLFAVENFLRDNPELIKRIVAEGHTVGNHTMHHPDMSKISFRIPISERNGRGGDAVPGDHRTGNDEILPPAAGKNIVLENLEDMQQLDIRRFSWSLAGVDWYQDQQPTKEEDFGSVSAHPSGAIVLLHNTSATNGTFWMSCYSEVGGTGIRSIVWAELS